jgi:hypothetical protein
MTFNILQDLPGADLVEKGLDDQMAGLRSIEACLVEMASPRLVRAGILTQSSDATDSETTLYQLLQQQNPSQDIYPLYNSLRRRIVSFGRSLDHRIHAVKKTERP